MRLLPLVALACGVVTATIPGVSILTSSATPPAQTTALHRAKSAAAELAPQIVGSTTVAVVEPPLQPPATWGYEPATVTVKLGTTVMWTNSGAVAHTVTADDGETFDSGDIQPKTVFSFNASSVGSFTYHCAYHPWMKGVIIVQP
jgi:plastocyanin